jgi:hypothetical protein
VLRYWLCLFSVTLVAWAAPAVTPPTCPIPDESIVLGAPTADPTTDRTALAWFASLATNPAWQPLLQNPDPEIKACATFLLRYLPPRDHARVTPAFLQENITLALQARHAHAWAAAVPWPLFLNDVLPYACLDEPRDAWRADFTLRFGAMVKDAPTREAAARLLNQAIEKNLGVRYNTQRRAPNQSPLDSMQQGMASCSGLSILLCDALRSVGIPARIAGVPTWATIHGNHNWVEVWLGADDFSGVNTPTSPASLALWDRGWRVTEYNPDAQGWDHAWFMERVAHANPAQPATWIYASSWQPTALAFPLVWNLNSKEVYGINRTEAYLRLVGGPRQTIASDQCLISVRVYQGGHRIATEVQAQQMDRPTVKIWTQGEAKDLNDIASFMVPLHAGNVTLQCGATSKTLTPEGGKEIVVELQLP